MMILFAALAWSAGAQTDFGGVARMDRTVHDFGDVAMKDGPVSCSFTLTNISDKDIVITSVVSSCGCTNVKWTREALKSGASGKIDATYANDEGPYPFDKTLTVYVSDVRRPILLHIRGVSHDVKKSLDELYPMRIGAAGFKSLTVKAGNLQQGEDKSGEFLVANLGKTKMSLVFKDVTDGLSLRADGPIAPGSTAKVFYTVTADRSRWGKNDYCATICAGKGSEGKLHVLAVTKENFSSMSKEQRDNASRPAFAESTWSFDPARAGARFDAVFKCVNEGKQPFIIYKIESDTPALKLPSLPAPLAPGKRMSMTVGVDTAGQPAGEQLYMLTLYTNSPLRPVINLFVAGFLK